MPTAPPLLTRVATSTGTPGAQTRAVVAEHALAPSADTTVVPLTKLGTWRSRTTSPRPFPVVAPSDAPGLFPHRIGVFLRCCLRWSMVLADAACWELVEVVLRSEPYDRTSPLGSFPANFVIVQDLPAAIMIIAASISISASATFHPRPKGLASVASPASRTVTILVGLQPLTKVKPDPRARARASCCSASSSAACWGAPLLSSRGAGAT